MIFAGVLIIAAVLVLILVISGDMKSAKMYQNAKRSRGRVAEIGRASWRERV